MKLIQNSNTYMVKELSELTVFVAPKVSSTSAASNRTSNIISTISSSFNDIDFLQSFQGDVLTGSDRKLELLYRWKLWCEDCNSLLVELKRQAIRRWLPGVTWSSRSPTEVSTITIEHPDSW